MLNATSRAYDSRVRRVCVIGAVVSKLTTRANGTSGLYITLFYRVRRESRRVKNVNLYRQIIRSRGLSLVFVYGGIHVVPSRVVRQCILGVRKAVSDRTHHAISSVLRLFLLLLHNASRPNGEPT